MIQPSGSEARVYPRACGGTPRTKAAMRPNRGLSPRLRGNHHEQRHDAPRDGSIPAPAGEPDYRYIASRRFRVYPRACGGTPRRLPGSGTNPGLSPRLRGNLLPRALELISHGSIPAPAGEPWCSCNSATECRVYPRACGGTALSRGTVAIRRGLSPRLRGNPNRLTQNRPS